MYKLLLTWRYLLTRYIALVSVISVTLGVATMIVVNAVMLGFSREMENRMHGVLSDVTISAWASLRGFDDVDARIRDVWRVAPDMIEAVTPTVTTQALLNFEITGGEVVTKPVELIGIDTLTQEKVTAISQYLQHRENRRALSFELREDGYDSVHPKGGPSGIERPTLGTAGWIHRREDARYERFRNDEQQRQKEVVENLPAPQSDFDPIVARAPAEDTESESNNAESNTPKIGAEPLESTEPGETSETSETSPYAAALANLPSAPLYDEDAKQLQESAPEESSPKNDALSNASSELPDAFEPSLSGTPVVADSSPLDGLDEFEPKFDKEKEQDTGAILGIGIVSGARRKVVDPTTKKTRFRESLFVVPGDDITLSLLSLGSDRALPTIVFDRFTVVDLYESRMTLYDQSFVFVPIEKLQKMRNMIAPDGTRMASHLLIKAKPGVNINQLRDRLRNAPEFPPHLFNVETWRDSQADMLQAVAIELSVLNVLLFLIIAVAGFGILAIFFMIVVEKTRDIGIMKSLGAGGFGVMQIFLFYGLALGLLGSGLGLILGIAFVKNINQIAYFLSKIMGHDVFNPEIYNFYEVPAIIEPWTVFWIIVGSIFIAVISGILPALRAARLKPVDALRV